MKLDLGCGNNIHEGYEGVDWVQLPNVKHRFDLLSGVHWPFEDNSVDEMISSHFIEHIPSEYIFPDFENHLKDCLFFFFDEAYRIAKPGCEFHLEWPAYNSMFAFQDPTHRRFIPPSLLYYLNKDERKILRVEHYNVKCDWFLKDNVIQSMATPNSIRQNIAFGDQEKCLTHLWNVGVEHKATLIARKGR